MKQLVLLVLVILGSAGCTSKGSPPPAVTASTRIETEDTEQDIADNTAPEETPEGVTMTIVYTNDEHGWMAGEEAGTGAAELAGLWATAFPESDLIFPISGGDNWTGPAISTWFEGQSMVEVMNAMGYAASAIGNHEFDFGLQTLTTRIDEADFSYLGANIRDNTSGDFPTALGIEPYTILARNGLQIGVIGLAYQDTPTVTNPAIISDLTFDDYEATLRAYVPQVREEGADLILVPSHICEGELSQLAQDVADLDIALFGGGHCNELFAKETSSAVLLGGGSYFSSFAFANFEVNPTTGDLALIDYGTRENNGGEAHPQVAEIVAHWQAMTDEELDVPIGYLENEIGQRSDEMAALITSSWLWAYPADVAITNWGGMRDRIPAGEVSYASIISVMPFENVLMDVTLTGAELAKVLASGDSPPAVEGISLGSGEWVLDKNGQPLDPEAIYQLLVTDFLYAGGDNFRIAEFDPEAYNTAINWRQPVIDWILAQESSPEKPLDDSSSGLLR